MSKKVKAEEIAQRIFYSFCNNEEYKKIMKPLDNNDYLLKIRADAVVDNVRLTRVMKNREYKSENWNFTDHFSKIPFDKYINNLCEEDQKKISKAALGFIFSNDPNGSCMRTEYGDIINVSESLKYFLFYMNLYFLDVISDFEIPVDVKLSSLMIGIRTMLKTETLDFDLDPRGIVPKDIENTINYLVDRQIEFVIGHECAHFLLGHLSDSNLIDASLYQLFSFEDWTSRREYTFYNHNQKQEFEADLYAFELVDIKDNEYTELLPAAYLFFIYLDIYKAVNNVIFPPINKVKTHPDPIDRLWNLHESILPVSEKIVSKQVLENVLTFSYEAKKYLEEDVGFNIENYETYGSVYLGSWRGPVLKDRVDY